MCLEPKTGIQLVAAGWPPWKAKAATAMLTEEAMKLTLGGKLPFPIRPWLSFRQRLLVVGRGTAHQASGHVSRYPWSCQKDYTILHPASLMPTGSEVTDLTDFQVIGF